MNNVYKIFLDPSGKILFLHDDALLPLRDRLGAALTKRASHVEPTRENTWQADLSPVGGPVLGPYNTRKEALEAEIDWLEANIADVAKRL